MSDLAGVFSVKIYFLSKNVITTIVIVKTANFFSMTEF